MNDTVKDLAHRLRKGWIPKAKRWGGDIHAEFSSGEVDVDATDAMCNEAADALEAQERRIAELEDLAQGRLEQMESDRKQALKWRDELAALQEQKGNEVFQALIDPENQPNQYGVEFGMHGPKMRFSIGKQSFTLDYEPDEPGEFDFMKRMLCHALSVFTPDVKIAAPGAKP